jgi:DNA-binding MarR family transcriptional regulator
MDREAKCRVMTLARALSRRRARGHAYGGGITAKALEVMECLLWRFHNARSGLCFPSYDSLAAAVGCARSTVATALKALERAGVLSWVNRLVRRRDPLDGRVRVMRTSNGYAIHDPRPGRPADSSKSESRTGTKFQASSPSLAPAAPIASTDRGARWKALRAAIE